MSEYSTQEPYKPTPLVQSTIPLSQWHTIPHANQLRATPQSNNVFCNDQQPMMQGSYQIGQVGGMTTNQQLVGPANPKTCVSPLVVPPSYAFDYWSDDYKVPAHINDESNFDLYASGYVGTSKCGQTRGLITVPPVQMSKPSGSCGNSNSGSGRRPNVSDAVHCGSGPGKSRSLGSVRENYMGKQAIVTAKGGGEVSSQPMRYDIPSARVNVISSEDMHCGDNVTPLNSSGDVVCCNTPFNPQQMIQNHLPTNFPTGPCSRESQYDTYNQQMFTQILEPNARYARQEVIEPSNANLGISFQQQFQPVTCQEDQGGVTYITHDPRIQPPPLNSKPTPRAPQPSLANTYDPRSFGYGTSYRSYNDTMTGQPRFFYDDVDAIRRPNYLTRSKIDHADWAESYGTIRQEQIDGPIPSQTAHAMADQQFLQDSLGHRGELQERYMRKYNNQIGWQRRQAPIQINRGMTSAAYRA